MGQSAEVEGLKGIKLKVSLKTKACAGYEDNLRLNLCGSGDHINSYTQAGMQIEFLPTLIVSVEIP